MTDADDPKPAPPRPHLGELTDWHKVVGEALAPVQELERTMGRAIQQIAGDVERSMGPVMAEAMRVGEELRRAAAAIQEHMRPHLAEWAKIGDVLAQFQQRLEEFPAEAKEGLVALANAGWYLDPEMPATAVGTFKGELQRATADQINEALGGYFRGALERIETELAVRHARRESLIRSAFGAHRRGEYELAIPLLLAQTDGVCFDLAGGRQLFGKGLRSHLAREKRTALEQAYVAPLLRSIPIVYGEKLRSADWQELNRHAVMHGESVDYGTEINSLKAISLLNYVSFVLSSEAPSAGSEGD